MSWREKELRYALEALVIAGTVEADVPAVETGSDVLELLVELRFALA